MHDSRTLNQQILIYTFFSVIVIALGWVLCLQFLSNDLYRQATLYTLLIILSLVIIAFGFYGYKNKTTTMGFYILSCIFPVVSYGMFVSFGFYLGLLSSTLNQILVITAISLPFLSFSTRGIYGLLHTEYKYSSLVLNVSLEIFIGFFIVAYFALISILGKGLGT